MGTYIRVAGTTQSASLEKIKDWEMKEHLRVDSITD